MDSKDNELARQQQERRKRVSRIKTGIIMTIAIWIAISILAIVVNFKDYNYSASFCTSSSVKYLA